MRKTRLAAGRPRKTIYLRVIRKKAPEKEAFAGKEGSESRKSATKRFVLSGEGGLPAQIQARIHQISNVKHHFLTSLSITYRV
jgi:hypothetical protein